MDDQEDDEFKFQEVGDDGEETGEADGTGMTAGNEALQGQGGEAIDNGNGNGNGNDNDVDVDVEEEGHGDGEDEDDALDMLHQHDEGQKDTPLSQQGNSGVGAGTSFPLPNSENVGANANVSANGGSMNEQVPESEALRQWRESWREKIRKKDEEAEARKKKMYEDAQEQLDEFYKKKTNENAEIAAKNRSDEQAKVADIEAKLSSSIPWERTLSLIDMQSEEGGTNKARMRGLLIQLHDEKRQT